MAEKIGVFDSGIGGLTVLRALRQTYPGLDMVYLGDVARVPYGGRSRETIVKYAREDAAFLLDKGVDAIVVACNTASALALDVLRRELPVPVYGVIDSAARQAAARTQSGVVGVIGTQATIHSGAYERELRHCNGGLTVLTQACPLLVPLIEGGIDAQDELADILCRRYLQPLQGKGMDVLILGCTHYPVYRAALAKLLPGVELINTGEALARELQSVFAAGGERAGIVEYYVTERSVAFEDIVKIMDESVDVSHIHVDASFI